MVFTELEMPTTAVRLDHAAVEAARLVRVARKRLLADAGAVTVAMLAEGRATNRNAARQWLHRHRTAGRVIAVDVDGTVFIPTFQLDDAFDLDPVVADTIEILTGSGMGPWGVWHWFYAVNTWIGERPVTLAAAGDRDALMTAAWNVIAAAE